MTTALEQTFKKLNWTTKQQNALAKWLSHGGASDLMEMAKEKEMIEEMKETLSEIKSISARIHQMRSESK